MKALFLTGGCGFIGSNFIRHFLKSRPEWKILNLDLLTYAGNRQNTAEFEGDPRYEFIQGNICDRPLVESLMPQADAVINFAAETHVDRSIENADDFLTTNILGLKTLLEVALKHRILRFVHISTDEVYGSLASGSADESAPLQPNSPYAAAKGSSDLLARSYWKTYGYPVLIVRSSNNFGPYQFPEKVIPLFITNLLEGKKVPLYGTGENRREWIFVEDNCRAISLILEHGREGEIYNVGSGHEMSNKELTAKILKRMGFGEENISYVQDRPGHDFRYSLDSRKLGCLGFKPAWTFDDGLKATVDWYRDHAEWWRPLKKDKFTVK